VGLSEEEIGQRKTAEEAQGRAKALALITLRAASEALEDMAEAMMAKAWREPHQAQRALDISAQVDRMIEALE
jgi:hypothetical protein